MRLKLVVGPLVAFTLLSLCLARSEHRLSVPPASEVERVESDADPLLSSLSGYKKWTLVNPVPQQMEPLAAIDCVAIIGRTEGSPHLHKYVSVYVNETGRAAMMTQRSPSFPPGSMIVKEKLNNKSSQTPELLTAMIKHEKGYNQGSGDWEYAVLDGAASEIKERGKLASCQDCHSKYKHSDFVTRTYLPPEVSRKLE